MHALSPKPPGETSCELADLLQRVAQRDRAAFEALYTATVGRLSRVAFGMLWHDERVEEVLQESYLKVWTKAPQYCRHIASPLTWMSAIVRNEVRSRFRRCENRLETAQALDENLLDTRSTDPAAAAERQCLHDATLATLDQLGARRRLCLVLLYHHDLSTVEVARHLDVPASTVRTWSQRGLAEMRDRLSGERGRRVLRRPAHASWRSSQRSASDEPTIVRKTTICDSETETHRSTAA